MTARSRRGVVSRIDAPASPAPVPSAVEVPRRSTRASTANTTNAGVTVQPPATVVTKPKPKKAKAAGKQNVTPEVPLLTSARASQMPPKAPVQKGPKKRVAPAVNIDVDADDSPIEADIEDLRPPARKKARRSSTPLPPAVAEINRRLEIEDNEDELDELDGSDENDVVDKERENDVAAARHLDIEAVRFTNMNTGASTADEGIQSSTSFSHTPNVNPPPTSDRHAGTSESFPQEQLVSVINARRASRLELELPRVNPETLATSRHGPVPPLSVTAPASSSNQNTPAVSPSAPAPAPVQWHERTNVIVTAKNRSYEAKLTGQPPTMRRIMVNGIARGKLKMITNDMYSPVGVESLKQLAHAALVEVAEEEGFDGEGDICHRLEEGDSEQYIKPIVSYVSGRIGNERKDLKNPASIVLGSFNLTSVDSRLRAGAMVHDRTYIYPQIAPNIFDYSRPMEHTVIADYIRAAFFTSTQYGSIVLQHATFTSTESLWPNELEVPKGMVALACAAIHACLQDHSSGVNESFPTKELDGVWKLAIDILNRIEKQNRTRYHQLMHGIYIQATRGSQPSAVNQALMGAIDWSAIASGPTDPSVVAQPVEHTTEA
ncbi:hypothetical protein PM082_007007 [Marasmius tenuissimus]|nr:hypothetical protein PM082_007007 [Marasmius tenuissimus]